jgi:hypothetical protein
MSDDPNPNVRYDIGGWISGPMMDPPLPPMIPPGSTAQRELLRAIGDALSLPPGASTIDDVRRLRLLDERAKLVTATVGRILRDPESDDDGMSDARTLRDAVADYPPDYSQHPLGN